MNTARDVVQLSNGRDIKVAIGFTAHGDGQGPARLLFSCDAGTGCALVQVWDTNGAGLQFRKAKMTPAEKERMAVVILRRSEAE